MYHVKFKSKISYLGEKISILPWQMAEQLAVEVDVKNVTEHTHSSSTEEDKPIYFVWILSKWRHYMAYIKRSSDQTSCQESIMLCRIFNILIC